MVGVKFVFGRVGFVVGVDVPITVGEELVLVIVVVVVVLYLLPVPNIPTSRVTTIAATLTTISAILFLNRTSLSIVMDNAFVCARLGGMVSAVCA